MLNVVSVSGLFILDLPFGFSQRLYIFIYVCLSKTRNWISKDICRDICYIQWIHLTDGSSFGSEIWGYFPASKWEKQISKYISKETDSLIIEKLHTKFCKYALGVRTKSSNIACRGELGSFPFLYNILINMLKYWCYLVKENKSNKLLFSALNLASDMEEKNEDSWLSCIRLI
jgi:hypothetical protein